MQNFNLTEFDKYKSTSNVSSLDEEKTKQILNRLFIRFERIFPKFWIGINSQEHLNGLKDEWFECFQEAQLTDLRIIQAGLKKARQGQNEYLPKASKFIQWCFPSHEDLGFPPKERVINLAYDFLRNGEVSGISESLKLVLAHAVEQTGRFYMRTNSREKIEPLIIRNYEIACRDFIAGNLKPIKKALEDNSSDTVELTKQHKLARHYQGLPYEKCIDAIKKKLGLNANEPFSEPKLKP